MGDFHKKLIKSIWSQDRVFTYVNAQSMNIFMQDPKFWKISTFFDALLRLEKGFANRHVITLRFFRQLAAGLNSPWTNSQLGRATKSSDPSPAEIANK